MRIRSLVSAFALLLVVSSLPLVSCSKKEAAITDRKTVLNRIPATTLGFMTWNTSSPAYQRFKSSPWGEWGATLVKDIQSKAQTTDDASLKQAQSVLEVLSESGLLSTDKAKPEAIEEGVVFIDVPQPGTVVGGAYLQGREGEDLAARAQNIKASLSSKGFTIKDGTGSASINFTITKPASGAETSPSPVDSVYVSAGKGYLAISTSADYSSRLFQENSEDGFAKIRATDNYKNGTKGVALTGDELSFGFLDIKRTIEAIQTFPGVTRDADAALIPVDSLSFTRTRKDSPSDVVSVSFTAKNDGQKNVLASLEKTGQQDVLKKFPAGTVFALSFDGQVINSLVEYALTQVPEEEKAVAAPFMQYLKSLKGIGLGVRKSSGDSPFPDVMLVGQSSDAKGLKESLKMAVDGMMESGMGGGMKWQEKDVESVPVSYIVTPFGVGAYVASSGDAIIVTSSDSSMRESLGTSKGSAKGMVDGLSKPAKELMTGTPPMLTAYTDFGNIADLVESVQGSLAMFTGGQNSVDPAQLAQLKKIGTFSSALNYKDNTLQFRTHLEAPAS